MLPSVDSRLACRVILLLISTARPVSVLLWIVLRNFLPPASARTITHAKGRAMERERERKSDKDCQSMTLNHSVTVHIDYY